MSTILPWLDGTTRIDIAFLCSQRVEGTAFGERARSIDSQAPGKSKTIIVQKSLWSQKQNCSIRCGMSYVSNICVPERQRRMYNGPSAFFSSIISATLRTSALPPRATPASPTLPRPAQPVQAPRRRRRGTQEERWCGVAGGTRRSQGGGAKRPFEFPVRYPCRHGITRA